MDVRPTEWRDYFGVFVFVFGVISAAGGWTIRWMRRIERRQIETEGRVDAMVLDCDKCRTGHEKARGAIAEAVRENRAEQWAAINDLRDGVSDIKAGVARIEGMMATNQERVRNGDRDDTAKRQRR